MSVIIVQVKEVKTEYVSEDLWWNKDNNVTGVASFRCQHIGATFKSTFDVWHGEFNLTMVCPGCDGRDMIQSDIDDLYEQYVKDHSGSEMSE